MLDHYFKRYTEISFILSFAMYLILPIIGPYIKSLGYNNTEVGLIFAVMPLTIIIFIPIIGNLSDKIGRKNMLCFAIIAEIIAFGLYYYDTYLACVIIARMLDAIAVAALPLLTLAKIEDHIKENRGHLGGIFLSVRFIGKLVAPLAGGLLADYYFTKFPFLVSIVVLGVLLIILAMESKFRIKGITKADFNPFADIKKFISFRDLRVTAFLGICAHAMIPASNLFLPIYIIEKLSLSNTHVGFALFILGGTHAFQGYFGRIGDRTGHAKNVITGLVITGLSFCAIFFVKGYILLLIVLFIQGIGRSIWNVSAWTLMSEIGEKIEKEGLVISSYLSIAKIGALLSFFLSGLVMDSYSFQVLALSVGIVLIFASVIAYFSYTTEYMKGAVQ